MKLPSIFNPLSNKLRKTSVLGGNLGHSNIDMNTLLFLKRELGISSFLDIGCGVGGMVFHAIQEGMFARGVEGDIESIPIDCPLIHEIDYRVGSLFSQFPSHFDLAWSIEVLEHIPEDYLPNVMADFSMCKYALITAAPPGWGGVGHINEQHPDYWIDIFEKNNFELSTLLTQKVRDISEIKFNSTVRHDRKQFIANRGLFFVNKAQRC